MYVNAGMFKVKVMEQSLLNEAHKGGAVTTCIN